MMRALALFLALTAATAAAEVKIVRAYTGWRDAASFKRISEYFTGRENTGGQIVLRSRPEERGGHYFLVRIANTGPARDVSFKLEVITSESPKPRCYEFSAHLPAGSKVFQLGLTGKDWPDRAATPMAWKLDLLDAAGTTLATEKSYLWEKPAGR